MRYRLAVRHFAGGSLGVDMYPLVITRRLGELVDTVLIDDDPVGQTDLLALEPLCILYGIYLSHA